MICENCEMYEQCKEVDFKLNNIPLPKISFVSNKTSHYYSIMQKKISFPYKDYLQLPYKITELIGIMQNELVLIQEAKMKNIQAGK